MAFRDRESTVQRLLQNQRVRSSRPAWRRTALLAAAALFLAGSAAVRALRPDRPRETAPDQAAVAAGRAGGAESSGPSRSWVEVRVRAGQTLYGILASRGLAASEIPEWIAAARGLYDLSRLRPGQRLRLATAAGGGLAALWCDTGPRERLVLERGRNGVAARREEIPCSVHVRRVAGVVRDSLFQAVEDAGEGPELAVALAEIFAWDIDFHRDVRPGDRFALLVEEEWRDGAFAGYGRILAASFVNRGRTYRAVYFRGERTPAGYYTPEGRSLRKQFLRSPLKFSRISSGFTRRRFHPILKRVRPHLGIDYAAPAGTPVRAAADGRVIFAGRKGGNGNFVKIRHNRTYMTGYLHLRGFARGIRAGVRVRQGQVIGYVGQTGLATGPHLCYRFYKNGRFVNPLTMRFPPAVPVARTDRAALARLARELLPRLRRDVPDYLADPAQNLLAGAAALRAPRS